MKTNIKLTGRMLNFTRLQLQGDNLTEILEKVEKKLGKQQNSKLPVVVSLDHPLDLGALWDGLWQLGLQPIGIVTGVADEQAEQLKIAIFPADGQRLDSKKSKVEKKAEQNAEITDPTATDTHSIDKHNENDTQTVEIANNDVSPTADTNENDQNVTTHQQHSQQKLSIRYDDTANVEGDLVHHQILRSGQSINHVGGDVILTKGINAGAEAITDYSLHIYGKAEGRLVAGATGDKHARIFCLKFNPSLVSVAGTYCLKESIPSELIGKAVEVSYADEQGLVFTLIE